MCIMTSTDRRVLHLAYSPHIPRAGCSVTCDVCRCEIQKENCFPSNNKLRYCEQHLNVKMQDQTADGADRF